MLLLPKSSENALHSRHICTYKVCVCGVVSLCVGVRHDRRRPAVAGWGVFKTFARGICLARNAVSDDLCVQFCAFVSAYWTPHTRVFIPAAAAAAA